MRMKHPRIRWTTDRPYRTKPRMLPSTPPAPQPNAIDLYKELVEARQAAEDLARLNEHLATANDAIFDRLMQAQETMIEAIALCLQEAYPGCSSEWLRDKGKDYIDRAEGYVKGRSKAIESLKRMFDESPSLPEEK